jgi:DNA-binding winged helix-turn-helix (wHTH) protein
MRYAFENFEFNLAKDTLRRDGVALPVRPKVLALLADLIQRRGRLVYKKELIERLWPDVAVGVTSLSSLVAEIRALLGDSGQRQALIRTESGRGYQFVAPVRVRPNLRGDSQAQGIVDSLLIDARSGELRRFEDALTELSRGRPHPMLICGEGGSGKHPLMGELIAMASGRGFVTASGRCSIAPEGPPLRPWIEVLRSVAGGNPGQRLPALLEPDLLRLIQCDPVCLSWLSPLDHQHSPQVRFRIMDSVCRYLTATARQNPVVVVVENLHQADAGSLLLFNQLLDFLGEAPLMLVGTLRPPALHTGPPVSPSLFDPSAPDSSAPDSSAPGPSLSGPSPSRPDDSSKSASLNELQNRRGMECVRLAPLGPEVIDRRKWHPGDAVSLTQARSIASPY